MPSCVSCPLSPSDSQCSHPCLVISLVGPLHLFLVLSLVSVYLVCDFPALLVWSLYLSASVCVYAPVHVPVMSFQSPHGMCSLDVDSCIFCIFDLNLAFDLYFVLIVATLSCWFALLLWLSVLDYFCTWLPCFFALSFNLIKACHSFPFILASCVYLHLGPPPLSKVFPFNSSMTVQQSSAVALS